MDAAHERRPIDGGYVLIGWPEAGDLTALSTREISKAVIQKAYPTAKSGAVPVWAGTLYRFVNDIKLGDYIVFPSKPDRMIHIGIITGHYQYQPNDDPNYPNRRRVEWRAHYPRTDFSQAALFEIGSAVTLFQIRNHSSEFINAINGQGQSAADSQDDVDAEDVVEQIAITAEDFILKRIKSELSPEQFEHFVAHLLECMGFHSRVTQYGGDGGVDIIAHKDELGFVGPIVKVQCKQITSVVGDPEVSKLFGKVNAQEFGLFVVLGGYTKEAKAFERNKSNLRLIGGSELAAIVQRHYADLSPRYRSLIPLKQVFVPDLLDQNTYPDAMKASA